MANLKVNAEFDTAMEQLTPETRAHADRFNERYEQLLGNDAFLKGKIEDANTNIERAMAVAQGKSAGYVFNTYSELIDYIAVPTNVKKFRLGDQFLIKTTDVPDYWWDNTVTTEQTDADGNIISGKDSSGKVIGALVELEARKVDLSKYDVNDAALFNNMSDQYSDARTYDVGDVCIYNNNLYKCVTAVEAAETFDETKWNMTSLAGLYAEQEKAIAVLNEGIEWKRNDDILQRSDNDSIYIKYTKFIYNKANAEATMKVASLRGIPEGAEIKIGNISDSQFYPKILAKDISYSGTSIAAIYIDNEGTIKYRQIKDNMPENYDVIVSIRWSLF